MIEVWFGGGRPGAGLATMEKRYIAFHSAPGCLAAAVGIPAVSGGLLLLFLVLPDTVWIQLPVAFAGCFLAVWFAFRVDRRSVTRQQDSRGDRGEKLMRL